MDTFTIITSCGALFLAGANATIWIIVKFNDLHHLEITQGEIKESLKEISKTMLSTSERISKIEGKCAANHG